jgi:hypothetical protein
MKPYRPAERTGDEVFEARWAKAILGGLRAATDSDPNSENVAQAILPVLWQRQSCLCCSVAFHVAQAILSVLWTMAHGSVPEQAR